MSASRKPQGGLVKSLPLDDPEAKLVVASEGEEDVVLKDERDPLPTDDEALVVERSRWKTKWNCSKKF